MATRRLRLDANVGRALLVEAATAGDPSTLDREWVSKVQRLSTLCEESGIRTHIAFLGAAILAKAIDRRSDLYALKPTHAADDNFNAVSLRSLCHQVLVPASMELGFHLGTTGREPLNNQPYFRMVRLGDETPVHARSRPGFDYLLSLIEELSAADESVAKEALRAFILVRRTHQRQYSSGSSVVSVHQEEFPSVIDSFVRERSEDGRRAQAVVAGLMDVVAGDGRVETGRVNDPSRKHPGDVCVMSTDGIGWEKAVEVRDKPVSKTDVQIFCARCLKAGLRDASLVMVHSGQELLDIHELQAWASARGLGLTLFIGWSSFVDQALYWAGTPKLEALASAVSTIETRLIEVEASEAAVSLWQRLTRGDSAP